LVTEVLEQFNILSDLGGISPKVGGFVGLISASNHCRALVRLAAEVIQSM